MGNMTSDSCNSIIWAIVVVGFIIHARGNNVSNGGQCRFRPKAYFC